MPAQQVDYDQIAAEYDRRYTASSLLDRGQVLLRLVRELNATQILEVGCGTGHWLATLFRAGVRAHGLDLSSGMLQQARRRQPALSLIRGHACHLPFVASSFDLVFCVNALHHFEDARSFVGEAYRTLRSDGAVAIIGSDPHEEHYRWYGYDYFEGTYATDLARFPPWKRVHAWVESVGFKDLEFGDVEHVQARYAGRQVLRDPFLQKNACSQLALLSEEAYRKGLQQILLAITQAETRQETTVFETDLVLSMLTGYKR